MSECNYCTMKRLRLQAAISDRKVTVIPWHGGSEVYVHPKSEVVRSREEGKMYWAAWFMQLPEECNC
jgi:hypothetical protein